MLLPQAVDALSALAHGHRLAVFRLLVRSGREGLPAGTIAREVGVPPSTLSTHLAILNHAGLIRSRRAGRSIFYSADHNGMGSLLGFLLDDCCDGRPELCMPFPETANSASCCGEPDAADVPTGSR